VVDRVAVAYLDRTDLIPIVRCVGGAHDITVSAAGY
jgi:hypothetical protein